MKKLVFFIAFGFLISMQLLYAQSETKLLRFPTIHDNQVVFSYASDLYTVDIQGGIARKLTNDPNGFEIFPRFSPDGKQIAFTAQYDGNTEVYVMPAIGGQPKRLTYTATLGRDDLSDRMGPNNIVMAWKDKETVVFRSRKQTFNDFIGQLFEVKTNGELSTELPLPEGSWVSYSPDGKKIAYNRVFREFRTWKYYEGGMADDVWIYDFESKQIENITNNKAQDIFPMWHGNKVYFLSDRDRTMNLFAYDINAKQIEKLTHYTEYDIKFPSLGDHAIVYENGGELYYFDLKTNQTKHIPVQIINDFPSKTKYVDASKFINSWRIAPDGSRLVFGARGDVFTVPVKSGVTRNLTNSDGAHDRDVAWSPNGKYITYVSDRTGEDEIYMQDQMGNEDAIQLTFNSETYKRNPSWSPDSKKILWFDKMNRLNMVDIDSKKLTEITHSEAGEITSYAWSPDSRWIAYSMPSIFSMSQIYVYNIETKKSEPVTDNWYDASNPVFDPEGNYLYFVSSRDFNPTYSWTEWNHVYTDMAAVYFVTLRNDIPSPFSTENNEVKIAEKDEKTADKKEEKSKKENVKKEATTIEIDLENISSRIVKLPVAAGNYRRLKAVKEGIYYISNGRSIEKGGLKYFDLTKKEEKNLGTYFNYDLSEDGKKMLLYTSGKYAVIDTPKTPIKIDEYVNTTNMKKFVDLQQEWKQIYTESWRQMRDFFYAPNMHGVDWNAMHDKYAILLPYAQDRNDVNYLIGELIGELNIGHAYVNGGDRPQPERIKMGLLGAKLSRDKSGYYRIDEILKGENWTKNTRSPLSEIGVNAKEGDFIVAIDGKSTKEMNNIFESLIGKAEIPVILSLNSKASENGAREVIVVPVADEAGLHYYTWVHKNIEKVNKATNGEVGYVHIPDMSAEGLNEFVKYYYPQLNKKALIIDDRGNGGGNVSPMIIERLSRELALYGMTRNCGVNTKPVGMVHGPKVLLLNKYSASDGDLFPYQFKKRQIGKTIGTRSWGGVVGIRGSLPFIDGGTLNRPEFAPFDENGNWVIEGYGVDPDIVIDNDPAKEYEGIDEQLNKAIEVILEEMKNYPPIPQIPPYPDKSK